MDQTSLHVPVDPPVKPQAAVSPLTFQSGFVEIDLNSPQPPSKVVDLKLVPPTVAGDHALPPQNLFPLGRQNGAPATQPSADAKVAPNPELAKPATEKPRAPMRRSHKLESSIPAMAPSDLPPSASISVAPSQPRVDPSRGEGPDQTKAPASNPSMVLPALPPSSSISVAPSQPTVDPSRGEGPDQTKAPASNPSMVLPALPLRSSISVAPSQLGMNPSRDQGKDPIIECASNPSVAPSALSVSTSISTTTSPARVDPSRGQGPYQINACASNPAVAPSLLSTSISTTASQPTVDPPRACADGVKSLGLPLDMANTDESRPADLNIRSANITEAAAKQAFLDFSQSKCCYSTAPAKDMTIQDLRHFMTYRYCLETFTEDRSCKWVTEPHVGQTSETSVSRPALQAWDVPVTVPKLFQDGVQIVVMPQTSSVQACSKCNGLGQNMCLKCHGTGRAQCMWCNGRGRRMQMEMCQHCYGNGTESCRMCQSTSQQCIGCSGKGRVLTYMQLTVTWKNNVYEFITDHNSEFSLDLFKNVKGEKLYTDEQSKVPAVTDFPDPTIIQASQNALEQHKTQFSTSCRVLRQRQSIEWLPLSKVQYCWKEKQLSYFVYGKENKVFVQNHPKTCCCVLV